MNATSHFMTCQGREIHYMQWGASNKETIVMWHGLARTGRDFDPTAAHFADRYRVICPDTLGRGLSAWADDPDKEYSVEFYAKIAAELIEQLGIEEMDWIGTSMGGALGTVMAAGPLKGRIKRLVLNDIGPALNPEAVARIRTYVTAPPVFDTIRELETYFRTIYKPYGYLSESQWRMMTETSARRCDDGKVTVHYDPRVMTVFAENAAEFEMWSTYDAVEAETLVLRGAESDLLTPETAEDMTRRGPKATLEVIQGCGHAPALNVPFQLNILDHFLRGA